MRSPTAIRPMDDVLRDMRALVTATRRLVRVAAEGAIKPVRVSAPLAEPGASSDDAPGGRSDDEPWVRVSGWDVPLLESEDTEDPEGEGEGAARSPLHGIWIAAATFVPTFLVLFFGISYLAGPPTEPRSEVSSRMPTGTTMEDADRAPGVPSPSPKEAPRNAAVPAITWVRGATFPDRDSAERLAAGIEREGYPSRVRRDGTPTAAWVVWIAKHPKGRVPSDRRE
jgi:hypothetical protein